MRPDTATVRVCALLVSVPLVSCLDRAADVQPTSVGQQPLAGSAELAAALIVSDPDGAFPAVIAGAGAPSVDGKSSVYVSLPPGTLPGGVEAEISNLATGALVQVPLAEGGLDPVAIPAIEGDSLRIVVSAVGGSTVSAMVVVVHSRPPVVVRTQPPPKKTGVPLNAIVIVVFSEPLTAASVTPESFSLLRDGNPVAGRTVLREGGLVVELSPDSLLLPGTEYAIIASTGLKDVTGDSLTAAYSTVFTTGSAANPVARVGITPDTASVLVGASVGLRAFGVDSKGYPVTGLPIAWSSTDTAIATVDQAGTVTARGPGLAEIVAHMGSSTGRAHVFVPALATFWIYPDTLHVLVSGWGRLRFGATDDQGRQLTGVLPADVSASDEQIAGVYLNGQVNGAATGSATIVARVGGLIDSSILVVEHLSLQSVAAGGKHACGLAGGHVFCWGNDPPWTLGQDGFDGFQGVSSVPLPVADDAQLTTLAAGTQHTCANGADGTPRCWGTFQIGAANWLFIGGPVSIASDQRFVSVTAGGEHSCALSVDGFAFCWGRNGEGQLGDGSYYTISQFFSFGSVKITPVRVVGGLTFDALAAGAYHTCGIASGGQVYCWGANFSGQLGVDSATSVSARPLPISDSSSFRFLSAGSYHSCGVAMDGTAYCWGDNTRGELGDGTTTPRWTPVRVAGGLSFSSMAAGAHHTCGLTTGGEAYCWGGNAAGQLGTGGAQSSALPIAVSGGLRFTSLSAGGDFTCGMATDGYAYCWGQNDKGQLGDGSVVSRSVPTRVWGQP
jgi:alpha-tubulin suppressor-like RCC1 family protein